MVPIHLAERSAMAGRRKRAVEYVVPFCLTCFFLILSRFFLGLSLADNTVELVHGELVTRYSFLRYQAWSPLYSAWFRELTYLFPDPLTRYFSSWGLVAAALALIPTLMRTPSAWIYNVCITVVPFLIIEPFVGQFGAALLVLSLCVFLRRDRSAPFAFGLACCVSFLVAFVRPEFSYDVFLSAAGCVGCLAMHHLRRDGGAGRFFVGERHPPKDAALVVLVLLLCSVMVFVMAHSLTARSGMAISQHFNNRAVERGELRPEGEFWNSDYAAKAFHVDFAKVQNDTATVGDFVRGNPLLYLRFVLQNLAQLRTIVVLACWCVVLLLPWVAAGYQHLRTASLFLAIVTLPPLASLLLVTPRWHYIVVFAPALLLFALQMMRPERWRQPSVPLTVVSGCLLIWLVEMQLMPKLNPLYTLERRELRRVECMRIADEDRTPAKQLIFNSTIAGDTYLKHPRTLVTSATLSQWPQFQTWVSEAHPAWIAADEPLRMTYGVDATQLDAFLQGKLHYMKHPCKDGDDFTVYTSATTLQ